jgi:hypothetical protein
MTTAQEIEEINNRAAYFKGHPIFTPAQNERTLICVGIDHAKQLFKITQESTDAEKLQSTLLRFGGIDVVDADNEDLAKILERAQLWYGDRIKMMKGRPSQCHANAAACWEANQGRAVLCTGFALSDDGLWRQHSWLIHVKPRRNRLVETTEKMVVYFGFCMTPDEAEEFAFQN